MNDKSTSSPSLSYRDAGVDIDAGNELVERIKPAVRKTMRPEVLTGLGGFGALFRIDLERWREPLLVSGTDGVGTKLKLAAEIGKHDTIGIDLVAMCVNDIVVAGAEPLFFLDYYATGKLELDVASDVVTGIARGCELAGAALSKMEELKITSLVVVDPEQLRQIISRLREVRRKRIRGAAESEDDPAHGQYGQGA